MIDEARTKSVKRLDEQAAATAAATGGSDAARLIAETGSSSNNRPPWQSRAAKRARGGTGPRRASRVQSSTTRDQDDDGRSHVERKDQGVVPTAGDVQSSSVIFSGDGDAEQDVPDEGLESVSGESLALMRAQAAIDELTRGDIGELRSFAKPPAAVNMVAAALMIALTGHGEPTAAGWLSAKRYMTNIDKLFGAVAGLDLNHLRVSQTRKLEAYVRNPAFRPDVVACVSLPASKICAWILGVLVRGTVENQILSREYDFSRLLSTCFSRFFATTFRYRVRTSRNFNASQYGVQLPGMAVWFQLATLTCNSILSIVG